MASQRCLLGICLAVGLSIQCATGQNFSSSVGPAYHVNGVSQLVATTRFLCRGFLIGRGGRMCWCHTSIGCELRTESSSSL